MTIYPPAVAGDRSATVLCAPAPRFDRCCTFVHDCPPYPLDLPIHAGYPPPKDSNRSLSGSAVTAGCWRRRWPRISRPRRTPSAATFAISPDAASVAACMAARCRSRRLPARLKSAPARRSIARRRWDEPWPLLSLPVRSSSSILARRTSRRRKLFPTIFGHSSDA